MTGSDRALCAHEALPHTPPGGKPPETLAPFPWSYGFYARERICQGFATPAQNAALDRIAHLAKKATWDEGKGASGHAAASASRWSGAPGSPVSGDQARSARHEALPHTSPGGKSPPETPKTRAFAVDRDRPSHGSRDREGAVELPSER